MVLPPVAQEQSAFGVHVVVEGQQQPRGHLGMWSTSRTPEGGIQPHPSRCQPPGIGRVRRSGRQLFDDAVGNHLDVAQRLATLRQRQQPVFEEEGQVGRQAAVGVHVFGDVLGKAGPPEG